MVHGLVITKEKMKEIGNYGLLKWVMVQTPSLKASALGDKAMAAGRVFHWTIVRGT